MSKYELNNDLRKYMGLDEPNEAPVARLERAKGGRACFAGGGDTPHHNKKDKDKKAVAAALSAAGAVATALGGSYVYNRIPSSSSQPQPQPAVLPATGRTTYTRDTMNQMPKPYKNGGRTDEIIKGVAGALGAAGAGYAAYKAYKRYNQHNQQPHAGAEPNPQQGGPSHKANASALMSDRPGGYKGEMSYDAQQDYLDRFQDIESPAYMKKLQDIEKYGQPQAGGLTIDHAQKKAFSRR